MNAISKSTREIYHSLRSEVIGTHYRLRVLRQLFTSSETVALLNKIAIRFFKMLKLDLLDTIIMAINRLLDPAKTGNRHSNASLQQLIVSLDPTEHVNLIMDLNNILEKVKGKSPRIRQWRKKWAAHRDLEVVQGLAPMPATSLPEIDDVLKLIGRFLNEFETACHDPREDINLYEKTDKEVEEIVESEQQKISSPIHYENIIFKDDGTTILDLITRVNSPQ